MCVLTINIAILASDLCLFYLLLRLAKAAGPAKGKAVGRDLSDDDVYAEDFATR